MMMYSLFCIFGQYDGHMPLLTHALRAWPATASVLSAILSWIVIASSHQPRSYFHYSATLLRMGSILCGLMQCVYITHSVETHLGASGKNSLLLFPCIAFAGLAGCVAGLQIQNIFCVGLGFVYVLQSYDRALHRTSSISEFLIIKK